MSHCTFEPLDTGHLQKGRLDKGSASDFDHIFFKLEIPKATAVVVVVGEEWNQLEKKEGSLWQGEVCVDPCNIEATRIMWIPFSD